MPEGFEVELIVDIVEQVGSCRIQSWKVHDEDHSKTILRVHGISNGVPFWVKLEI